MSKKIMTNVRRRVKARQRITESHILQRKPFNPEQFLGEDWGIYERVGKRIGDNLDAGKIITRDYLLEGELYISGEERFRRIKASTDTQLDAEDFLALWQKRAT